MNASDINYHATTVDFIGKAKAKKEDAALIDLVKKTIGEKICVLTTGITETSLTEDVDGKSWIGVYDNVEYADDIAVEAAYDLGQQGKKAIVISYDELV